MLSSYTFEALAGDKTKGEGKNDECHPSSITTF